MGFAMVHSNGEGAQNQLADSHMETWDDLRFVAAIARSGSLSGAARVLGVHHATVFRRLGAIEERMGVRLFDRLPKGYAPTPAGQEVAEAANRMEDDVSALHRRVAGRDLRLTGTVRLATVDSLATLVLPRHLAAFRAAHPGIAVELVVSAGLASLSKREADVALRATAEPPDALIGRRLATIVHGVFGTAALAAMAASDPAATPWIALDDGLAGTMAARWIRKHVAAERIVLRANNLSVLGALAEAGVGLTVLPCFMARAWPGLVPVGPPLVGWDTALWLLTHEDLRTTARVRALLDFLASAFAAERDRLAGRD